MSYADIPSETYSFFELFFHAYFITCLYYLGIIKIKIFYTLNN